MELTGVEIIKFLGIIGVAHLLLAILSMVELKMIPFYTLSVKKRWFIVICLLPIIGAFLFHQRARLGWQKIDL